MPAVRRTLIRALGSGYVLSQLPHQRRVLDLSLEQVLALRDRRLRRLVRHAATTVPHYRDLFARTGITWRDVRSADDLIHLPQLDKATVRAAPEQFVSTSWRGRHAVPFVTSGTTGARLAVYHDVPSLLANYAHTALDKVWASRLAGPGGIRRQMSIYYAGTTVKKIWKVYREMSFIPPPRGLTFVDVTTPVDQVIETINRVRPDMLSSYGSYLEALYRLVASRHIELHRPRLVRYGGDGMTDEGRRLIEERFGVPVQAGYNAVEQLRLGLTCARHSGYHLREDLCAVWLRDHDGHPAPPGQPGEVMISNLTNRGTVLLNYGLGDQGRLVSEPCPCGSPLRRLVDLDGRIEDVLQLPGGRLVHPRAVWGLLKDRPEILRYQLVQEEQDRCTLKLVTDGREGFDGLAADVGRDLQALLGPVRLDLEYAADLATSPSGKFRPVVSRCGGPGHT